MNATSPLVVSPGEDDRASYLQNGFLVIRRLFDSDEIDRLRTYAEQDIHEGDVLTKEDQSGNRVSLRMWGEASDDLYGMFARNVRVVDLAERLLGDSIYLYSSKMILKNARDGGAWEWHQDFGYWYSNACLAPSMLSCMVAVDPNRVENGCLQVLPGSHHLGRLDHLRVNEQFLADPERVQVATERFDRIHVELEPGDALFFHCNLLHRSDANNSDMRRWSFICSYNTESNRPFKQMRSYGHDAPLETVEADSIRAFVNSVACAGPSLS